MTAGLSLVPVLAADGKTYYAIAAMTTDGSIAPAHTAVDAAGAPIGVALDATVGAGNAMLGDILTKLGAIVEGVLTTADQNGAAFGSALAMTAGGSAVAVGRSVEILCTVPGNVSLQLGGSPHIISISDSPYTQTFPYAVTGINTAGTTATATYSNLY